MSAPVGSIQQHRKYALHDASGTITTGGTPQLVLAERNSTTYLMIQNNSSGVMFVEMGGPRATCTINAAGTVTGFTITNSGFGYTYPPVIRFEGGGNGGNSKYLGLNLPGGFGPNSELTKGAPAAATATVSGGSVTAINLSQTQSGYSGGIGYVIAPYVWLVNSPLDPYGCATPSSGVGWQLAANGGALFFEDNFAPTDPIAIWSATTGAAFTCKWTP